MKKWILIVAVIVASLLTLGAVTSAAPPEETTTTLYSGAEPAATDETGRVQYEITDVDLGRCLDGHTQYGFLPCETPEEMVAVGQPPVQMAELPATGPVMNAIGLSLLALWFVGFGWLMVQWARDDSDIPDPDENSGDYR